MNLCHCGPRLPKENYDSLPAVATSCTWALHTMWLARQRRVTTIQVHLCPSLGGRLVKNSSQSTHSLHRTYNGLDFLCDQDPTVLSLSILRSANVKGSIRAGWRLTCVPGCAQWTRACTPWFARDLSRGGKDRKDLDQVESPELRGQTSFTQPRGSRAAAPRGLSALLRAAVPLEAGLGPTPTPRRSRGPLAAGVRSPRPVPSSGRCWRRSRVSHPEPTSTSVTGRSTPTTGNPPAGTHHRLPQQPYTPRKISR